jgi:hypothetical protein
MADRFGAIAMVYRTMVYRRRAMETAMASRREIMKAGIAVPALSVTGGLAGLLGSAVAADPLDFECFVCDQRYAASMAAARAAQRRGFDIHVTAGDVTDLWYHRLDEVWRRRPAAIAGVTGEDALFVLERLGWDRGLRVIYRGRHSTANGIMRHELAGAEGLVRILADADTAGVWADSFAAALGSCGSDVASQYHVSLGARSDSAPDAAWTSWLLSPTPAARARG